jgi:hypothetical protein
LGLLDALQDELLALLCCAFKLFLIEFSKLLLSIFEFFLDVAYLLLQHFQSLVHLGELEEVFLDRLLNSHSLWLQHVLNLVLMGLDALFMPLNLNHNVIKLLASYLIDPVFLLADTLELI